VIKFLVAIVAIVLTFAACQDSHSPMHSLYVGYVIEYGEADKKEPTTIDSNHGIEVWTWYEKGAHSIRAKVEFNWRQTPAGLDWKVVQTYP